MTRFLHVLASRPFTELVNRATCALGTISYSGYLTHFAALDAARRLLPPRYFAGLPEQPGLLVHFATLWVVTLALTVPVSVFTYRLIEQPGIALGNRLIRRGEMAPAAAVPDGAVAVGQPEA